MWAWLMISASSRCRLERKGIGVAAFGLGTALVHAAVEQDAAARGVDFVQGAGDLPRRSVEMYAHGDSLG